MNKYSSLRELIKNVSEKTNIGITFINSDTDERFVSYKDLYKNAQRVLFELNKNDLKIGKEVILLLDNKFNFINCFWACILGGIVPVPISIGNNAEHKLKVLNVWKILNTPYLITNTKALDVLLKYANENNFVDLFKKIRKNAILIECFSGTDYFSDGGVSGLSDVAFIQFSSGSTGDPKGVILSHENLLVNIDAIINGANCNQTDSTLSWMPLTHDMGLIGCHLVPLASKMNQYIMPTSLFIRNPMLWLKKASEHKVTLLSSPNFGYKYFLNLFKPEAAKKWDLSHVRLIFNGAEPISFDICNDFLYSMSNYGLKRNTMFNVYGLAEASLAVSFPNPEEELSTICLDRDSLTIGQKVIEQNFGTNTNQVTLVDLGKSVKNCSIRISDEDNNILDENTVGYIQIKGRNVTRGYYNNKLATNKMITQDGWLKTGDLGLLKNGRLFVTGRTKDVIFVNGHNYYAHDIERVAEKLDGIELGKVVACSSFNSEIGKEEIIILVLFKRKVEDFLYLERALRRHLNVNLGLEILHIIPVKNIPKTTSGKIQRYKLKTMYEDGKFLQVIQQLKLLADSAKTSINSKVPKSATEIKLMDIWSRLLGTKDISVDENFFELGGNSILLIQMHEKLDKIYPGKLSITDILAYPTISKLSEYIEHGSDINSKRVHVGLMLFSPDFFYQGDTEIDRIKHTQGEIFGFKIVGDLLSGLNQVSKIEKVEVQEILFSLFVCILAEFSQSKKITAQAMLKYADKAISLNFNFNTITSMHNLLANVGKGITSYDSQYYSLRNVNKIKVNKDTNCIIPFFYKQNLMVNSSNHLDVFDIALGIDEKEYGISLELEYNSERLKKHKIQELFHLYLNLIHNISSKYKNENEGIMA